MQYPADNVLIARGKYSTLRKEKKAQLERLRAICATIVTTAHRTLDECQNKVQDQPQNIVTLATCVENITSARDKIIVLNANMAEIEPEAWPK